MPEPIVTMARNIFGTKYKELEKIRDQLKSEGEVPISAAKLKELEDLVAELGKNYRKAEKIVKEIKKLAGSKNKKSKK